MISFPNAKINIGLNIVKKREDGYHDIESVFYPIPLCDVIEIVPGGSQKSTATNMYCSGINVGANTNDNLCVKAYKRILKEKKISALDIYLHKTIPMGAGLGGGSADAAFLIRMINDKYSLGFDDEKMQTLASDIGSDCAFFIKNKPAYAYARGEKLSEINLQLGDYKIWLIKPFVHVNTKDAYSMIKPKPSNKNVKDIVLNEPIEKWKDYIFNDFELPVFAKHPEVKSIKDFLYNSGALYASMTGSGSAVYGIFKHLPEENTMPFKKVFSWQKSAL